jgi:hypothetical protein
MTLTLKVIWHETLVTVCWRLAEKREKRDFFLEMTNLSKFTLHDLGDEKERLAELPVDFNTKIEF